MKSKYVFNRSAESLYSRLSKIYDEMMDEETVEIFGNLDFDIVDKIDGKKERIAKLKANRILIKVNASKLPKSALKYIIAHEVAHTMSKGHTKKYWKLVENIYPNFQKGKKLLFKYKEQLS